MSVFPPCSLCRLTGCGLYLCFSVVYKFQCVKQSPLISIVFQARFRQQPLKGIPVNFFRHPGAGRDPVTTCNEYTGFRLYAMLRPE
jgi:hypothetical protein